MEIDPAQKSIFLDASDVRTLGLKPEEPMTWGYSEAANLAKLVMSRTTNVADFNPNDAPFGAQQLARRQWREQTLSRLNDMARQLAAHVSGEETADQIENFLREQSS